MTMYQIRRKIDNISKLKDSIIIGTGFIEQFNLNNYGRAFNIISMFKNQILRPMVDIRLWFYIYRPIET